MEIKSSFAETTTINGEVTEILRLTIDGAITQDELDALCEEEGYPIVAEHTLTLAKKSKAEEAQDKLDEIAQALPDEIAVEHIDLYPVWMEGMALGIGDRVQHDGGLYRVQQAHTAEHPPSVNTAALYTRIQSPGDIQAWVTGQSYAKDAQVTHGGKTWISMVDNNVWEPGAAGVYESIWKETAK
jgi:hypothetical protein